jgi:hypothetical protein
VSDETLKLHDLRKPKKEKEKTELSFSKDGNGEVFFSGGTSIPKDEDIRRIISEAGQDPTDYTWEIVSISWNTAGWTRRAEDCGVKHSAITAPTCIARYKITKREEVSYETRADIDSLVTFVTKAKPAKALATPGDDSGSFVALLSDFQMGNGEAGGSAQITRQLLESCDKAVSRAKLLRKVGKGSKRVYLLGVGDLVESCSDFYPMQAFSVDLNQREQERAVRHVLLYWIDAFVDAGFLVTILGIGGNHGENRRDGKAYTSFDDNRDVQAFEIIAEIIAQNPERYGGVAYPKESLNSHDLTATIDVSGMKVSIVHGHQFGGGAGSKMSSAEKWLAGQALGKHPVADCDILFSGHFHHFLMSEATGRTLIQACSSDTGSEWFRQRTGASAPSGVVTLRVGRNLNSRGWDDLSIV